MKKIPIERVRHAEHVIATHTAAASGAAGAMSLCDCELCERAYDLLDEAMDLGGFVVGHGKEEA